MHTKHNLHSHSSNSDAKSGISGKAIAMIVFALFSISLIGFLVFVTVKHSKCKKNCIGGDCSFFGKCSLTPAATINGCNFAAGQYLKFTPDNCTPKDDTDGSCNDKCYGRGGAQKGDSFAYYVKSLGGCITQAGNSAFQQNCST